MTTLIILAAIFFAIAVYYLTTGILDIPTIRASKVMLAAKKRTGEKREKLLEVYILKLSEYIAHLIKMDKLRRDKLRLTLDIAGIVATPEVYMAKAFVTSALVMLLALPLGVITPLFSLAAAGMAVLLWFSTYYSAFDIVKKRRKVIEREIPRFATTIAQNLETDRDVLKILTSYRRVAGKDFSKELDITVADMKTGNYENALLRLENRVGSSLMSDVVRGLIGVLRGDDQQFYFKMICFDMRQLEQNNLKKEAQLRPKKMQKYSMMMLICIILIYAVVLSVEVLNSLGAFFS